MVLKKGNIYVSKDEALRLEIIWLHYNVLVRGNKVMLNTKDLVFKMRLVKKLTEWYVSSYIIEEVMSANIVKLRLLASKRIYLVSMLLR